MVNKKGFIRILEAAIALIIVFVYVTSILPKAPKPTGEIPAELDNTIKALIKQVQNDPNFRKKVVVERNLRDIKTFIGGALPGGELSIWKFAFRVCTSGTESSIPSDCNYYVPGVAVEGQCANRAGQPVACDMELFNLFLNTKTAAIYTKAVFLSKTDASGPGPASICCPRRNLVARPAVDPCQTPRDPRGCPIATPTEPSACCENQVLTMYLWTEV